MICYTLKCADGHTFESWFQSADAFAHLDDAGLLSCPDCGGTNVAKAVMAPRVSRGRSDNADHGQAQAIVPDQTDRPLAPQDPRTAAIAKLRERIESESEYVGMRFASEARAIHTGDAPDRPIYGEAHLKDARELAEDGVPVAPLPFLPKHRAN